jgi:hypothetical protein
MDSRSANHGSRRRLDWGTGPLRQDAGLRPNDRLAGKGKITPLDADLAHREQILERETVGTDGRERSALFRFAAFRNRLAHLAGMLAVEGFHDSVPKTIGLRVFDQHFRPRDPLQNSPVPASEMEQGTENEDVAKEPHAKFVLAND